MGRVLNVSSSYILVSHQQYELHLGNLGLGVGGGWGIHPGGNLTLLEVQSRQILDISLLFIKLNQCFL
jgi:hypothetical protein